MKAPARRRGARRRRRLASRLAPQQLEALLRLQAAYNRYRDEGVRRGQAYLSPEEWARRVTSGQPRRDAEGVFGADYARTGRGSGPRPGVRLTDIPRPVALD